MQFEDLTFMLMMTHSDVMTSTLGTTDLKG